MTGRVVLVVLLALLWVPAVFAADEESEKPTGSVSATTGRILNEVIEFLNNDDYASAREEIGKLKLDRLSPYERSRVEQILSSIDNAQGKYTSSRKHLEAAIAAGGMNEQEISQARYNIAQLYMIQENWKEGAKALEEWFRTAKNPNSAAYYLLAVAYYQQNDLKSALEPAKKAVELMETPRASWMELLMALYLERDDYKDALPLAERLVSFDPSKKSYWLRLASLYQAQEKYDKALAATQVAYNGGLFTEDSEYRRLADLLRFNEIPARCARVLTKAIDDKKVDADSDVYEKLANCRISAREFDKALPPLSRAAELSDNGNLYVRLAEVQMQRKEWQAVSSAVSNAIDKGDLDDPAYADLLMGIAFYNQDQLDKARPWFRRAAKSKERREAADNYLKVIAAKMQQKSQS